MSSASPDTLQNDGLPLLLGYQQRWINETAQFAVCEKSRRIGLSWADAAESVLHAAAGKGNVYYQSFSQDMTRTYIDDCAAWAVRFGLAVGEIEESLISSEREQLLKYSVTCDSGKCIQAVPSSPRALRSKGKPGDRYVLDEAAFCDDLDELLKAATAVTQWGGSVRIVSTHNGETNAFNQLVIAVREGKHPRYALHRITLDDAIADGLARRVASVTGREWHEGDGMRWRNEIVSGYTRPEQADEELFCIPAQGGGAWLRWDWIRAAGDPAAGEPDRYAGGPTWIGVDIARRRDLWVAVVIEQVGDVLWVRELCTERDITFAEQAAILDRLVTRYRPVRIAIDQTGMGEAVVEQAQEQHGTSRVEGVILSAGRRLDVATALREAMEDGRIRIPDDEPLRQDLHAIKAETGQTGAPRLVAERSGTDGHADRFWALALAVAAAADHAGPLEYLAGGTERFSAGLDDYTGYDGGRRYAGFR